MSRVGLLEQIYSRKRGSALEFRYDSLWAPPIRSIFSQEDINELYKIATSLKYNSNIEKKYELIDSIMTSRGFKKAHCGTNRVVYNFLDMPTFVAKVAVDRVGMKDSPAEYINQEYFKPFCCKIFEVDSTGVLSFVERVNPITSLEEFLSVSDDIFNMMITKIIGKYVVDDLGAEKFMNYGIRYNANGTTFGPVIIDFPYAYELDGSKLICNKLIKDPLGNSMRCYGEIDYDAGLNKLYCTKCGKTYTALELKKNKNLILFYEGGNDIMRAVVRDKKTGKIILDSGINSDRELTPEEYNNLPIFANNNVETRKVGKTKKKRYPKIDEYRKKVYTDLQLEQAKKMGFNPVIEQPTSKAIRVKVNYSEDDNTSTTSVKAVIKDLSEDTKESTINDTIEEPVKIIDNDIVEEDNYAAIEDLETLTSNTVEETEEEVTEEIEESTEEVEEEGVEEEGVEEETSNNTNDPDVVYSQFETEEDRAPVFNKYSPEYYEEFADDPRNNRSRNKNKGKNYSKKKKKKDKFPYDDDMSEY